LNSILAGAHHSYKALNSGNWQKLIQLYHMVTEWKPNGY